MFHKGHYNPLSIARDFETLENELTTRGQYLIMVVVHRFIKMAHFIASNNKNDVTNVAKLYFKETLRLHDVPKIIIGYEFKVSWCILEYIVVFPWII